MNCFAQGSYRAVINGTVAVWGDTNDLGSTNLAGLTSVKAIAAGWSHNVAFCSNGTVKGS